MFWSGSDILFNVDQICYEAPQFLARAIKAKATDHDMALLKQALAHALVWLVPVYIDGLVTSRREAAAKDLLWRAMLPHEDVPFLVTGIDAAVFEAWTRGKLKDRSLARNFMHANR